MSKDRLAEYRSERDTAASGEPAGRRGKKGGGDLFVVQRHDASKGTVVVRDTGTYRNLTGVSKNEPGGMATAVEDGHLKVWLDGEKLSGAFSYAGEVGTGYHQKVLRSLRERMGALETGASPFADRARETS